MRKDPNEILLNEISLTEEEFIASFNANMPEGRPQVTPALLKKFKDQHESLFKADGHWTLDQHRKRLIDWLPQNL